ncbi:MAG: transaldolase family protein [Candidatus Hadarchaeum sp.]|uniref:transaldolase family protein n=1 Tax=Candidatus Hadarchaeum sp. TaxID=2883567 RepID=UPI003D0F4A24
MKIFIDTAKVGEIREAISWGIVDGVTTNPSLIREAVEEERKSGKYIDLCSYIEEICRAAGRERPVSLEVISQEADSMVKEARFLYQKFNPVANNVVIKIPINTHTGEKGTDHEGLAAIKKLEREGIPTNVTLVMTPEQALLAAKAGATYVSPFAGRIDDYIRKKLDINFSKNDYFDFELIQEIFKSRLTKTLKLTSEEKISEIYCDDRIRLLRANGNDSGIVSGVECVRKIVNIFRKYNLPTKIIAASVRNARQMRELAETGCDICTAPLSVIRDMLKHPKTEEGVQRFYSDAIKAGYDELFKSL